jgi:hypothetical protein
MPEPVATPSASPPSSPPSSPPTLSTGAAVQVPRLPPGAVQSDPPQSEPQKRWADMQQRITAERPWSNPDLVFTKDDRGVITSRPRTDGSQSGAPDAGTQPQPPVGPASVGNDGRLRVGDFELSEADVRGLMERKSLEDGRRANMPATASEYGLDLPNDFVLPPGAAKWEWNLDNPMSAALIGQAKEFAHAHGLDQPAFSKLLALYAGHQIAEQTHFAAAQKAQVDLLGPNAPTRVDAVNTYLHAMIGNEHATVLRQGMFTAAQVKAYEALMRAHSSQGVSGNPGAARDGAYGRGPQKLSDEAYGKLTYAQKAAYAAQFDQSKFSGA